MNTEVTITTLKNLSVDVSYGYTESASEKKVGPRFLRITDIQNGSVNWASVPYCVIDEAKLSKYLLEPGDIVVARTGNSTGENYLYKGSEPTVYASYLIRFRIDTRKADPMYVWYNMRSDKWWLFVNGAKTGSAQAGANAKVLGGFELRLPNLQVQRKVASILRTLDDKIQLNRQMNQTLEAMAQALFKSWFVDFDPVIDNALAAGNEIPEPLQARAEKRQALGDQRKPLPPEIQSLFPDRFVFTEEMGWVPEGWSVSCVGDEFDVTMGQSPPGDTYNTEGNGSPFFQGRADFGFRYPSNRVYCTHPKRMARKDDTLVSVRAPVGDANIAYEDCAIGRGVAAVRHKSGCSSYSYYSILQLSEYFKVYEGEGTVFGSINQKGFNSLPAIKAPLPVLTQFRKIAKELDLKISVNSVQLRNLGSMRDTLLPKLLSGELRIPDAEKQIAEVL